MICAFIGIIGVSSEIATILSSHQIDAYADYNDSYESDDWGFEFLAAHILMECHCESEINAWAEAKAWTNPGLYKTLIDTVYVANGASNTRYAVADCDETPGMNHVYVTAEVGGPELYESNAYAEAVVYW